MALVLEGTATVIDQIIDLHDRIIGRLLNAARHKHQQRFQQSGRRINDQLLLYGKIGQALVKAKAEGKDAFAAIETVLPWTEFTASVGEANKLSQPEEFDFIHLLAESWPTIRRYAPALLEVLQLKAAPAGKAVLEAEEQIRTLNAGSLKELPADAPTAFIKKRWEKLVRTDQGLSRKHYELCVLCELKNALRSGDIWVKGSRQFRDFEDYLIPAPAFGELRKTGAIPLSVNADAEAYLKERTNLLEEQLALVDGLALSNNLPDALITEAGLKMTPLDAVVPPAAQDLIDRTAALLPHVKITELLLEVDAWTGFTRHFTHLKTGEPVKDKTLLLTTILADAINLGLVKMALRLPESLTPNSRGRRHGTSAMTLTRPRWLIWSTLSSGIPSPPTGATAPPPHRTASGSDPAAAPRAPVTSIRSMAPIPAGCFTPTSLTNIRPSAPKWSTSASGMPPMSWTAFSITNPTCGLRSTTPTPPGSPTMFSA